MAPSNLAAWLHEPKQSLQLGPAEIVKPGLGEILVETRALAINPVDWKMQDGLFYPDNLPRIMGNDIAGAIVELGEGVSEFSNGQRVLAHGIGLVTRKPEHGAFQNFVVLPTTGVCPIPDSMSYEEACVLPMAISTAAMGMFLENNLGLPLPSHEVKDSGKTLLVWGGSSSVGSAVIQLAVAAGLRVIATASRTNFDFCKDLGASEVFDYHSLSIVGDLTATLQNHDLAGAYDGRYGIPLPSMSANAIFSNRDARNTTECRSGIGSTRWREDGSGVAAQ